MIRKDPLCSRRQLLAGTTALVAIAACRPRDTSDARFAALEHPLGGRLGVLACDTGGAATLGYRADERFAMCSTFKLVLVAAVLARVDAGREDLARRIGYGPDALLAHAPVTRAHVAEGALTVAALCEAAITVSDNTAANLLLATLDGPPGVTRYLRALGDTVTRLDRLEPALNTALAGDPRDTTTPRAMARTAQRVLVGGALRDASRARLVGWMGASTTGSARLRAGLPPGWRAGDKTGTGPRGTMGDVAIVWPPGRAPWVIAAYITAATASDAVVVATFADVAREVARRVVAG